MERLRLGQAGLVSSYWELDGVAEDPGTVTVTIVRDSDGSVVVSGGATTGDGATRSFSLTPMQCGVLDHLTCTWTASTDGSWLTTYAEVAGGFTFDVRRARMRPPLGDMMEYPTEAIVYYRTLAEQALEDICGVAFVPRYTREIARVGRSGRLSLTRRKIRHVVQITTSSDAGPVPLTNLNGLRIPAGDSIWLPMALNWISMPVEVAYYHGFDEPIHRVSRAAIELARRWLVESPWDERMTGYRQRDGGELSILTASKSDPFDIPEVVAISRLYGTPMVL